jgi:3-oxoadipate enol-lactonase
MRSTGFEISVKAHDITVCYNDIGGVDKPIIIFIHGFPFNKSTWNDQVRFLSLKFRCIAYDLRGFGHSTDGLDDLTIESFADDLNNFMEILQIDKAVLCGLSMGGYIALQTYIKYHIKFSGLILCDTQCHADSSEAKNGRKKSVEQINGGGKKDFAEKFVKNVFSEETLKKEELVKGITDIIVNTPDITLVKTLVALGERPDTCYILNDINVPCLIMCGKEDKITPPKLSHYLHQQIKNSEIEIISNAGHLSNLENPAVFNDLVEKFIERRILH